MSTLFRPEALAARASREPDELLDATPLLPARWVAVAAVVAVIALSSALTAEYRRSITISGALDAAGGSRAVAAPLDGTLLQFHRKLGDSVVAGEPIATVSEARSNHYDQLRGMLELDGLAARHERLDTQLTGLLGDIADETASLESQLQQAMQEQALLEHERSLQQARIDAARSHAERYRSLAEKGLVPALRSHELQQQVLHDSGVAAALARQAAGLQRQTLQLRQRLQAVRRDGEARRLQLQAELDELERQLRLAGSRQSMQVLAPEDGVVAALLSRPGDAVARDQPLFKLLPHGHELVARGWLPASAGTVVGIGAPAVLRYAGFPYQRYGHAHGEVVAMSIDTVAASEHPARAAGAGGSDEAGWLVEIRLDRQSIGDAGSALPLRAGMHFEAELVAESRTAADWLRERGTRLAALFGAH